MQKKSKKLRKLERNRKSVFVKNFDFCVRCGSDYQITKHEIYEGRNRQNSMNQGFVIPLCLDCHREITEDKEYQDYWKQKAQTYFEKNVGTREDFMNIFHKNYL